MSAGPKASGGRNIVAYFAGHLANLVNGGDTLDPIQDFAEVKAYRALREGAPDLGDEPALRRGARRLLVLSAAQRRRGRRRFLFRRGAATARSARAAASRPPPTSSRS